MSAEAQNLILHELYPSLDERWRPEDVARKVLLILEVSTSEKATLNKAAKAGENSRWFNPSRYLIDLHSNRIF
ncbi:MAG: hypothetical protein JWN70_2196 [Planctomycetaceae bacterium]|nr:hypothetical protein [Planctomycetaceae bacterium]